MRIERMSKLLLSYSACMIATFAGCLSRTDEKAKEAEAQERIEVVVEDSSQEAPATPESEASSDISSTTEDEKMETDTPEQTPQKPAEQKETQKMSQKIELPSGLAYEIIKEGDEHGATPVAGRNVTVHYTGWLNNEGQPGNKFDSSVDRGRPFSFDIGVGQVIRGWDEGVMTMRVGEHRRLFIPAKLGYGARGVGPIPANSDLIFDVKLISVG